MKTSRPDWLKSHGIKDHSTDDGNQATKTASAEKAREGLLNRARWCRSQPVTQRSRPGESIRLQVFPAKGPYGIRT